MGVLKQRFLDLVVSIYIYNEYRGFKELEKFAVVLESQWPEQEGLIAAVHKHAADEKKHYLLFQRYFRNEGRMPFSVSQWVGFFDVMARLLFGKWMWDLESRAVLMDRDSFVRLCRIIWITESRGLKQIETILSWRMVREHRLLHQIFETIRKDEPSHFLPYAKWLSDNNEATSSWLTAVGDLLVHYGIALIVFPVMFLSPWSKRQSQFYLQVSPARV